MITLQSKSIKSQFSISPTSQVRRGFTLVEMLVVITIIIVLAALSFVGVTRARESAQRSGSLSNLRQLGIAMTSFTVDNNGFLPATRKSNGTYWPELVWGSLESQEAFMRPGSPNHPISSKGDGNGYFDLPVNAASTPLKQPIRWNYVINGGHAALPFAEVAATDAMPATLARGLSRPLSQITDPSRTLMLAEGNAAFWLNADAKTNSPRIRKWSNGTSGILWFDGSAQSLNPKELRAEHFTAIK
jgi:prepilin-type N-terminal cleavage/methylation domain-containing protein